jgi:hypothetical protein
MDPDPELALFFSCYQSFVCLLLTVGLFRSHNTVEIKNFLKFLLVEGRIRIRANNIGSYC